MMLKAVTPCYTGTVYYKYNRIPVFYHLPFAFTETNSKMGLFQHFVFVSSIDCFFYLYVYIFWEICLKIILHLAFSITLWNIYYLHLFFKDIEDDLNRIVDFLIIFWVSFQISFLNFINVLGMFFDNFTMEAIKLIHDLELNCKYIYII